ncbi:MAG: hypothetical protein V4690_01205 [Patescibacteria group bacterium]
MSILSFIKKDKEELALLIDIGSGLVSSSLVLFSKNQLPKILFITKSVFPISEDGPNNLLKSMETGLNIVLKNTLKEGIQNSKNKKIHKVLATFSSPWFYTLSKSLKVEEKEPFYVTSKSLKNLADTEAAQFKSDTLKTLPENAKDSLIILESSVVNTRMNGYPVNNVLGKKTKSLEADIWLSLIPESVEKKVLGLIQKHTHISKEHVLAHSFPLVLFSVIRDSFLVQESFVTMDITSETTHISFVCGDIIKDVATMPIGRSYIVRQIAKRAEVGMEIAESYLRLYTDYKLDTVTTELIDLVVGDIEKEWAIYLEDALLTFSPKGAVPKTIFITGEKDINKIFLNFLAMEKKDKTQNWRNGLKLVEVDTQALEHLYIDAYPKEKDIFVGIETVFYDKKIKLKEL